MQVDTEKEINKSVLKRPRKENLSDDEELAKVENLQEQILEAKIIVSGKNEIVRLPEIETVFYENEQPGVQEPDEEIKPPEGRRIVDLMELGKRLWCSTCREVLSLSYLEKEYRRGLGSLLLIRCHKCNVLNEVNTSKLHEINSERRTTRYDVNTDVTLCVLHTGLPLGTVNRVLSHLKIPPVNSWVYKKSEEEIGKEEVAAIKAKRSKFGYPREES
ncbi:uncharacterized protein LOC122513125 [Leptopilina heterotoma]|uniref:uncharacterized protein LOC122513125 n=1 Tax=Leptopilina heterotoma TaxID=63436 RepID=UPI001CA983FA|nr:uncharacterized protein LOC122513125 [Leptopilina heterotoma]